jgi:hypothetical protein
MIVPVKIHGDAAGYAPAADWVAYGDRIDSAFGVLSGLIANAQAAGQVTADRADTFARDLAAWQDFWSEQAPRAQAAPVDTVALTGNLDAWAKVANGWNAALGGKAPIATGIASAEARGNSPLLGTPVAIVPSAAVGARPAGISAPAAPSSAAAGPAAIAAAPPIDRTGVFLLAAAAGLFAWLVFGGKA